MGDPKQARKKIISIDQGVIGPVEPRKRNLKPRSVGDYPEVPAAYLEAARNYSSSLILGPPICDELIDFLQHMLTEEEARLIRHFRPGRATTAKKLARAEGRTLAEIEALLETLSVKKRVLLSRERRGRKKYYLLPVVPGTFEYVMLHQSMDELTEWHREFARRFERLWETGYMIDYIEYVIPTVRYLPVNQAIQAMPMALPVDRLEETIDRYKLFGVAACQCRMAEEIVGRGCGKPLEACVVLGEAVERGVDEGWLRKITLKDVLEIKKEAEAAGCITWTIQEAAGYKSSSVCSCCGCCCHMLRTVTEWNAPGAIAPAHFIPRIDRDKCDYCGKCARNCPMGALVKDTKNKISRHLIERCIGCGLCQVACDKQKAIEMEPNPGFQKPSPNLALLAMKAAPRFLLGSYVVWKKYK